MRRQRRSRKGVALRRHITEPCADADDEIGLCNCLGKRSRSAIGEMARKLRMIVWQKVGMPHSRCNGDRKRFRHGLQGRLRCIGFEQPSSDQQWPFGLRDHIPEIDHVLL